MHLANGLGVTENLCWVKEDERASLQEVGLNRHDPVQNKASNQKHNADLVQPKTSDRIHIRHQDTNPQTRLGCAQKRLKVFK